MWNKIIDRLRLPEIRLIFTQNNIDHVYLFWSYARWEEKASSDIDLIYVKKPWEHFSLLNIWSIVYQLEEKLGKKIDLVSENSIKPEIKDNIIKDKKNIF